MDRCVGYETDGMVRWGKSSRDHECLKGTGFPEILRTDVRTN